MIEYTIKNYFDFFVMTGFYKSSQIFVCSKTGVQFLVICCLIAMADTFEERSDIQGCWEYRRTFSLQVHVQM